MASERFPASPISRAVFHADMACDGWETCSTGWFFVEVVGETVHPRRDIPATSISQSEGFRGTF
jgi:hypothetical protein